MKVCKEIMFREMAEDNTTSWIGYLASATKKYNKTPHGTTYNEAPEEVNDSALVKFRLLQDNSLKLKRNAAQVEKRKNKLEGAGGFRAMLPRSQWQRAFKPRFGGEVF